MEVEKDERRKKINKHQQSCKSLRYLVMEIKFRRSYKTLIREVKERKYRNLLTGIEIEEKKEKKVKTLAEL